MKDSKNKPSAVFAPKDWEILKKAVGNYVSLCEQYCVSEEEMTHALSLYHRIGRILDVKHEPYEQTMKRLSRESKQQQTQLPAGFDGTPVG